MSKYIPQQGDVFNVRLPYEPGTKGYHKQIDGAPFACTNILPYSVECIDSNGKIRYWYRSNTRFVLPDTDAVVEFEKV